MSELKALVEKRIEQEEDEHIFKVVKVGQTEESQCSQNFHYTKKLEAS